MARTGGLHQRLDVPLNLNEPMPVGVEATWLRPLGKPEDVHKCRAAYRCPRHAHLLKKASQQHFLQAKLPIEFTAIAAFFPDLVHQILIHQECCPHLLA